MTGAVAAGDWIAEAAGALKAAGVDDGRRGARILLADALAVDPASLFARPETTASAAQAKAAEAALRRRLAGEPLARILGRREFWSLEFHLNAATLDPRADTETVVEAGLDLVRDIERPTILDLGVGSGCILLAILSERTDAVGVGVDYAPAAVAQARVNAETLGLARRAAFVAGDWATACASERFDLVVSNPPYIAEAEGPAPDAATRRFDPPLALWGGPDGLDAYREILPDLARLLRPGGAAALEVGAGQADQVAAIADAAGLASPERRQDLAGIDRCLVFRPEKIADAR